MRPGADTFFPRGPVRQPFFESLFGRHLTCPAGPVIQGPEEAFVLKVMGVREKGSQARKERQESV